MGPTYLHRTAHAPNNTAPTQLPPNHSTPPLQIGIPPASHNKEEMLLRCASDVLTLEVDEKEEAYLRLRVKV